MIDDDDDNSYDDAAVVGDDHDDVCRRMLWVVFKSASGIGHRALGWGVGASFDK